MTVLTKRLERLAATRGEFDADDLLPLVPEHTRPQVIRALQNLRARGAIELVRIRYLFGDERGRLPSVYRIAGRQSEKAPAPRIRAASVWDYAQQI